MQTALHELSTPTQSPPWTREPSLGAQTVKSLPATQETRVQSLEEDAPLEK